MGFIWSSWPLICRVQFSKFGLIAPSLVFRIINLTIPSFLYEWSWYIFSREQSQKELYKKHHDTAEGRIRVWLGLRQIMNATDRLLLETRDLANELKTGIHMVQNTNTTFYMYCIFVPRFWLFHICFLVCQICIFIFRIFQYPSTLLPHITNKILPMLIINLELAKLLEYIIFFFVVFILLLEYTGVDNLQEILWNVDLWTLT